MFGIADYGAFVAAIVLFLAIPGPGNLALITSTGKGGVRAGMAACMGVIAADQVLMWMAVAGVAGLLAAYPAAFHAVQWLGAVYLGWMGYKMLTAKPGDAPVLNIAPRHYFRQGAVITLLNPHVYLDTVVLIGSIGARQDGWLKWVFVLGAASASLTWFVVLAFAGRRLQGVFANPRAWRVLDTLTGAMMFVLAWWVWQGA